VFRWYEITLSRACADGSIAKRTFGYSPMDITKNDSITVREFEPHDAPEFALACRESIATVGKWMPWCHSGYTPAEALDWITICERAFKAGTSYDLGLFRNSDALLLGSIAINDLDRDNRIGNIGYWVRESQQNQGYALPAVELIKAYGFHHLQLERLEIVVLAENTASRRVAEKSGAEFECIAKSRLFHDGCAKPAAIYSFTDA